MAFALDAIVAGTTYSLSDGNPFSLEGATGLAMAPVRRLTEQAPRQDGDTDLGYRLDPRTITLSLNFTAASLSDLDTYRDLLINIIRPIRGYSVLLRVTRDDGEVRQIECQTVGPVDVRLVREERAGKVHRAVVQLRAANPLWHDPSQSAMTWTPWWLAGGLVAPNLMKSHVEFPSAGQAIDGSVTSQIIGWTLAWRTQWNGSYTRAYVFGVETGPTSGNVDTSPSNNTRLAVGPSAILTDVFDTADSTYILSVWDDDVIFYRNGTLAGTVINGGTAVITGSNKRWRSDPYGSYPWPTEFRKAMFAELRTTNDIGSALHTTLMDDATIAYSGNWPEAPEIRVTGPIADFTIQNYSTGETLDFTGGTVSAGDVWTIDLSSLPPAVTSIADEDKTDFALSGLDTFRIQPHPTAAGGTNVFIVDGSSITSATRIDVIYRNYYLNY